MCSCRWHFGEERQFSSAVRLLAQPRTARRARRCRWVSRHTLGRWRVGTTSRNLSVRLVAHVTSKSQAWPGLCRICPGQAPTFSAAAPSNRRFGGARCAGHPYGRDYTTAAASVFWTISPPEAIPFAMCGRNQTAREALIGELSCPAQPDDATSDAEESAALKALQPGSFAEGPMSPAGQCLTPAATRGQHESATSLPEAALSQFSLLTSRAGQP